MNERYWMFRRQGVYYLQDRETGKQQSLRTKDKQAAQTLFHVHNEAWRQPNLNLQIARAYLGATDPMVNERTWQRVMEEIVASKSDSTCERWKAAVKDSSFDLIRNKPILNTRSEDLLAVMRKGTVSTNVYLRRIHNFAIDMGWLPWPLVPKRQWPAVRYGEKRAITIEEHQKIIAREGNTEKRAFYDLAWHFGASQHDLANLCAEDIDWENRLVTFHRRKTGSLAQQRFGKEAEALLKTLPKIGPLFPNLQRILTGHRATEFKKRCRSVGISGVSLHSYRYAWAERAKTSGYPERFAQLALGHNSKAVHRAYARKAQVTVPALEDYEDELKQRRIIPFQTEKHCAIDSSTPSFA